LRTEQLQWPTTNIEATGVRIGRQQMIDRTELAAAVVAGLVAFGVNDLAPRMYLVPVGFVAAVVVGVTARRDRPPFGTAMSGARAGVATGVVYAAVEGVLEALHLLDLVPAGFVVDNVLFQLFAVAIMLVPLYAIEGAVGAPAVQWLSETVRSEVAAVRSG
jgi:hypothetical protein